MLACDPQAPNALPGEVEGGCGHAKCDGLGSDPVEHVDALLRDSMVAGVEAVTGPSGHPRYEFLLLTQQGAQQAWNGACFRQDPGAPRLLRQPDVEPADALDCFMDTIDQFGFECATAISVLHYMAIRDTFRDLTGSDDLFNENFRDMAIGRLGMGTSRALRAGGRLWEYAEPQVGDHGYFLNPAVTPEAQAAGWNGENVVYLGDGMYFGHPFGITDADTIIGHLNTQRKAGATESAYLQNLRYPLNASYFYDEIIEPYMERPLDTGVFYRNKRDKTLEVPDGSTAGVRSAMTSDVRGSVIVATVMAYFDTEDASDLVVGLEHNGVTAILHDREPLGVDGKLRVANTTDAHPELDVFLDTEARGLWTLWVYDAETGATSELESWSLSLATI